jgi:hypothetical protein
MIYLDSVGVPWRVQPSGAAQVAPRAAEEPLPVATIATLALTRARTLQSEGRLAEALAALDAVREGDPLQSQADELRGAIQDQLLAYARASQRLPPQHEGTAAK